MRLSTKLPLLTGAMVLATAVLVGVLGFWGGSTTLRQQVLRSSAQSVRTYADAAETYLRLAGETLEAGARAIAVDERREHRPSTGSADEKRHLRAHVRSLLGAGTTFEHVMLVSPEGAIRIVEPESSRARGLDISFAAWFRDLRERRTTVVSDLVISPVTQAPSVVIAVPVADDRGRVARIFAGALRLDVLSAFGRVSTEEGCCGIATLVDRRGLVVADQARPSYVEYQTDVSEVSSYLEALAGRAGSGRWTGVDGVVRLGAWQPVASGWAAVFGVPESVVTDEVRHLALSIGLVALAAAVVVAAVATAVVRRALRPVEGLVVATAALRRGDFSTRVPGASGELGELTATFNAMAADLATKERALRRHAAQLQRSNADLEAFTYSVSHDLRAPVRAMVGFAHLIETEEGEGLSDEGRRRLGVISWSARKMADLVDDLLRLSRVGKQALARTPVDPAAVATDVMKELDPKGVEVRIDPLPQCDADPALLRHVYANLLSNAVKFTQGRAPASVEVGYRNGAEQAYFVRDTGVGFDMRYAGKLFRVFERLHGAEYEGTGVGLAIVKQIVDRHGGRVWAESEPGKGSTFLFTIGGESDG